MLDHKEIPAPSTAHIEEAIQVKAHSVELEEDGVRIALTVVDTPGFGDQIDNDPCFGEILGYIERQFDEILSEETRIKRNPRFRDNRSVHGFLPAFRAHIRPTLDVISSSGSSTLCTSLS